MNTHQSAGFLRPCYWGEGFSLKDFLSPELAGYIYLLYPNGVLLPRMKAFLKKWSLRIAVSTAVSLVSILGALLNPGILYAHKTVIGNFSVYHQLDLEEDFYQRLEVIEAIVRDSELYDSALKVDICLNDGSLYPNMLKAFMPPAFGWGIANKAVFQGTANFKENYVALNGYRWNAEQLFIHELTHLYQFNHFGFWNSNPVANHPEWKWEGYAEYTSRQGESQASLFDNIKRLERARAEDPSGWGILFEDGTVAPRVYYDYWLLVQFCLDSKGMNYRELMDTPLSKTSLEREMRHWFEIQSTKNN